ncbi:protein of unknown function [Burkholderia multivorans]
MWVNSYFDYFRGRIATGGEALAISMGQTAKEGLPRMFFPGWNGEEPQNSDFRVNSMTYGDGDARRREPFFEGCDIKLSIIRALANSANGMAKSDEVVSGVSRKSMTFPLTRSANSMAKSDGVVPNVSRKNMMRCE